jgi:hypothetical protein
MSNTVDPLLMALAAITLLALPVSSRRTNVARLSFLAVVVLLGSLTRLSFPLWIAIGCGPWIAEYALSRRRGSSKPARNYWLPSATVMTLASVVCWIAVGATLGAQGGSYVLNSWLAQVSAATPSPSAPSSSVPTQPDASASLRDGGDDSTHLPPIMANGEGTGMADAPVARPPGESAALRAKAVFVSSWNAIAAGSKVVVTELGELVVLDRALLLLLGLAAIGLWRNRLRSVSYLFPAVLFVTLLVGALNSTLGVNFRFQLPTLPFAVLVAGMFTTHPTRGEEVPISFARSLTAQPGVEEK